MSEVRSADRVEWITRMLRAAALVFVAPLAASADVTFVHWSDTHVTGPTPPGYKLKIVEDMNTIPEKSWPEKAGGGKVGPVDFALCTGDLTDSGKPEEWEGYLALRAKIAFPSYDAMGNHDFRQGRSVENGIRKLHGETYYSFDKGGVHVVVMNEYTARHRLPDFNAAQLDWLAKDLAKVEKGVTPVVLAMHSPPLRGKDHFMSLGESINRFADILKGHKAVIVHGHKHFSVKARLDDTWWVLGSGKAENGDQQDRCYNVIRVTSAGKVTCVPYDWVKEAWDVGEGAFHIDEPTKGKAN